MEVLVLEDLELAVGMDGKVYHVFSARNALNHVFYTG